MTRIKVYDRKLPQIKATSKERMQWLNFYRLMMMVFPDTVDRQREGLVYSRFKIMKLASARGRVLMVM